MYQSLFITENSSTIIGIVHILHLLNSLEINTIASFVELSISRLLVEAKPKIEKRLIRAVK